MYCEDEVEIVCETTDTASVRDVRWLRYPYNMQDDDKPTPEEDAISETILEMRNFLESPGTTVVGLGKGNVRRLVAAYNSTWCQLRSA